MFCFLFPFFTTGCFYFIPVNKDYLGIGGRMHPSTTWVNDFHFIDENLPWTYDEACAIMIEDATHIQQTSIGLSP